ncbi:MAG: tetratricopeptide repeat protein, partial [Candidatus Marinimicrobia bacterium]|nr:tetratricopeptide repeat protein [Candidatus Neomarinimicrobiota bacterium]
MRLYPYKVDKIDENMIYKNFTSNYRFRNLNNPDVYFSPNTQRLMQNYRTAVLQSVREFLENGEEEKAAEVLKAINEKIPEEIIPQYHPQLTLQTGRFYFQLGDTAEYIKRIDDVLGKENLDEQTLMLIAQELVNVIGDYDKAEKILLPMYRQDPYNNWVAGTLVRLYRETGEYASALNILGVWLKTAPNDHQAQALKVQIEALANE